MCAFNPVFKLPEQLLMVASIEAPLASGRNPGSRLFLHSCRRHRYVGRPQPGVDKISLLDDFIIS